MTYRKHPSVIPNIRDFIAPKIWRAMTDASENLRRLGIRHVICGGVAVSAYGHVRATKDVDFLAGPEVFVHNGLIVSLAPGVSFAIDGIPTDMLSADEHLAFLDHELANPVDLHGLPLISPEGLVAMKLVAGRPQDRIDVKALIALGATTANRMRRYLDAHPAPADAFRSTLSDVLTD